MLEHLRAELEDIAFMLGENADRKEIHSKVVKCLVLVQSLSVSHSSEVSDADEINKVSRRLAMWSKPERQNQYNSRILNAFLELSGAGYQCITEENLSDKLGNPEWFSSNFVQMKTKAERNHGKVFDITSGYIRIWDPVRAAVDEYGRKVFNS